MLATSSRELNYGLCVIFHVPHGERAAVHTFSGVMRRGRSPFLTKYYNNLQSISGRYCEHPNED